MVSLPDLAVRITRELTARQCAELVRLLRAECTMDAVRGPLERRFPASSWIAELRQVDYGPGVVADVIEASGAARQDERSAQHVDFVWTGPETSHVSAQSTEGVFLDLIAAACHRLILVTYAAREVELVLDALEAASQRDVDIIVVCETQLHGRPFNADTVARLSSIPRLQAFAWTNRPGNSSMHAKIVAADGRAVLVTSANLTESALLRNIEAGILVTGGSLPGRIDAHFRQLVSTGSFERV
jgi:cardiolipin synthase